MTEEGLEDGKIVAFGLSGSCSHKLTAKIVFQHLLSSKTGADDEIMTLAREQNIRVC